MTKEKNESNFVTVSVSFDWQILKKADEVVGNRLLPGINNRSALISYALQKVFKEVLKNKEA
jgi:metal-responsive CopG/Arc/MetJ family transcriptional regulator